MAKNKDEITKAELENLPHWYNKSNINFKLLESFAKELAEHSTQQDNTKLEIFLKTTTGENLDSFGKIFKLFRRENESDDDFRARILAYWPGFSGGGTKPSIKSAIAKATNIQETDVTITENFLKSQEKHFYSNNQERYKLNKESAKDTTNLLVKGTVASASYTFIKNTDYKLEGSDIVFNIGGTNPDNNTIFTTDYDYFDDMRPLVNINLNPSNISQVQIIRDLMPDIKAAGIEPRMEWSLIGGVLNDTISIIDTVNIISDTFGSFIIEKSYIDSSDLIK